ncbi:MAG: hypothetical protein E6K14_04700 [Methanobacteriota archaeon]|nr:MAG: hypothetical protein E6K14_04700 [Euryarchaeota archaeon]
MSLGRARPAVFLLAIVLSAVILVALAPTARAQGPRVLVATVDGAIDRSTVEYFSEALDEARTGGYAALVVRFDTPGPSARTRSVPGRSFSSRPIWRRWRPARRSGRSSPSSSGQRGSSR